MSSKEPLEGLQYLDGYESRTCLVATNGFEQRVPVGIQRLQRAGMQFRKVFVIRYPGAEHEGSYKKVIASAKKLVPRLEDIEEIGPRADDLEDKIASLPKDINTILCDISGLSRSLMLGGLTRMWRRGLEVLLLYTEAKEYYPLRADFEQFLAEPEKGTAFARLALYEDGDVIYSSQCNVEDIPELPGASFPNHPVMLISFLTFKRSRLSAVLNRYETNARVLIEGEPVRRDLHWRLRALEIINFDLLGENKGNIVRLPTLSWEKTYHRLVNIYRTNRVGYRFNVLLAPLGGKMQTVGAWYFAVKFPDVKVITSTPTMLFPDKYSRGYSQSHLIRIPRQLSQEEASR